MNYELALRDALGALLEIDPAALVPDQRLDEQGVDSLLGLRFARKVEDLLGAPVELEWIYDYPTIATLAAYLEQRAASERAAA